MLLYHTTSRETADLILAGGFRDGHGGYMTEGDYSGVWLSDYPLDEQSGGATGDAIVVDAPEEVVLFYEWVEEGKGYREFLVPATIVNTYPRTVIRDWPDSLDPPWLDELDGLAANEPSP